MGTLEKWLYTGTKPDEVREKLELKFSSVEEFDSDLYTVILDESEGYAYVKLRSVRDREGVLGYSI